MSKWTTGKVLEWAAGDFRKRGFAEPRLEAEVLLTDVLGVKRIELYIEFDRPLIAEELTAYRNAIERRRTGEPAAYITGTREFWSLEFMVDGRVLVPRPETELLVEAALSRVKEGARLLDLCTGSGCVAVALAKELEASHIDAVDISRGACQVARINAAKHEVDQRVRVLEGDLFDPVVEVGPYGMIVANPPYVADDELAELPREVQCEPTLALAAGPEGLDIIVRILKDAPNHLEPGGWLLLEVDPAQVPLLLDQMGPKYFENRGIVVRDLAGRERIVGWHT